MQDQYFIVQNAGFPSPGTLQTGLLPSSLWPQALLAIQHASITMLLMTFRYRMLPVE